MSEYLMYLRKSQLDRDFDDAKGETLLRHKSVLTEFAEKNGYHIAHIFEEVVSGDSLAARPEMQKCLEYVNTGEYEGVLCMDIDRLSRGSSFDSGYITNVLQLNNCKIITPQKTYDLNGEYDEQFTDLKFMFARMELRSIAKRTYRGRMASVNEGKWIYTKPYGYNIVKLQGTKGSTLAINEKEAEVVRLIFQLSSSGMGYTKIANEMVKRNIAPPKTAWSTSTIDQILRNKVYCGYVPVGRTRVKRVITSEGAVKRQLRPLEGGKWLKGLHQPIVSEEDYEIAYKRARQNTHQKKGTDLVNMFAGLLRCKYCGKILVTTTNSKPVQHALVCRTPLCTNGGISINKLEKIIIPMVMEHLSDLTVSLQGASQEDYNKIYTQKINALNKALMDAETRQSKICEYLENGTYTLEIFQKRNEVIVQEIEKIKSEIAGLKKPDENTAVKELPKLNSLAEIYWEMSANEKNKFLKAIISNISYERLSRKDEPVIVIDYKL